MKINNTLLGIFSLSSTVIVSASIPPSALPQPLSAAEIKARAKPKVVFMSPPQPTTIQKTPGHIKTPEVTELPIPDANFIKPGTYIPKEALKTYMPALKLQSSLDNITMANFKPKSLLPELYRLMRVSHNVKRALYQAQSAQDKVQVSRAEWLPHLSADMDFGRQKRDNPGETPNTIYTFNQQDVTVNQLIYDFGKTRADIDTAKMDYQIANNNFKAAVENELVAGITTYSNIIRDAKTLTFSIQSAQRIQSQLDVEKIRFNKGAGLKTDVLEVQGQLSGAKARLVSAKASLGRSENNYFAVFQQVPGDFEKALYPRVPRNLIPKTMAEALSVAHQDNTSIKDAEYQLELTSYKIKRDRSVFLPTISGDLDFSRQHNVSGTKHTRREYTGMLDLSYNIFNGGGDVSQLLADNKDKYAAEEQLRESYWNVDEQIRNAWEDYAAANLSYKYLVEQVAQLKQFLVLARKERLLGRRSVLDVLLADINVINAQSEATTAHARAIVTAYTLLQQMGVLDMHAVELGRPGSALRTSH